MTSSIFSEVFSNDDVRDILELESDKWPELLRPYRVTPIVNITERESMYQDFYLYFPPSIRKVVPGEDAGQVVFEVTGGALDERIYLETLESPNDYKYGEVKSGLILRKLKESSDGKVGFEGPWSDFIPFSVLSVNEADGILFNEYDVATKVGDSVSDFLSPGKWAVMSADRLAAEDIAPFYSTQFTPMVVFSIPEITVSAKENDEKRTVDVGGKSKEAAGLTAKAVVRRTSGNPGKYEYSIKSKNDDDSWLTICEGVPINDDGSWACQSVSSDRFDGDYEVVAVLVSPTYDQSVAQATTDFAVHRDDDDDDDDNPDDKKKKKKFEQTTPELGFKFRALKDVELAGSLAGELVADGATAGSAVVGGFLALGATHHPFKLDGKGGWSVAPVALACGRSYSGTLHQTKDGSIWGDSVDTNFATTICMNSPAQGGQYVVGDKIGVKGQASPNGGSQYIVLISEEELPVNLDDAATYASGAGILCRATADSDGNWSCPFTPKSDAPGTYSLYVSQYIYAADEQLWQQVDLAYYQYSVAAVPMAITLPDATSLLKAMPFTIAGTGQPRTRVIIAPVGDNAGCSTVVDQSGQWTCGNGYGLPTGSYSIMGSQYPINSSIAPTSTATLAITVDVGSSAPTAIGPGPSSTYGAIDPVFGRMYARYALVPLQGSAAPGTVLCEAAVPLSEPCISNPSVIANSGGSWSFPGGFDTSYTGTFPSVLSSFDGAQVKSVIRVPYAVSVPGQTPVAFTSLMNAARYRTSDELALRGIGQPGAVVCVGDVVLSAPCGSGGMLVDEQGRWNGSKQTYPAGNYRLAATAFVDGKIQSSAVVYFSVEAGSTGDLIIFSPVDMRQFHVFDMVQLAGRGTPGQRVCIAESLLDSPCADALTVSQSGNWMAAPTTVNVAGEYRLVASAFSGNVRVSHAIVTFSVVGGNEINMSFTNGNEGLALAEGQVLNPAGRAAPSMTVCVGSSPIIKKPTSGCATALPDGKGGATWSLKSFQVPTDQKGMHMLYGASFKNDILQSTNQFGYWVIDAEK